MAQSRNTDPQAVRKHWTLPSDFKAWAVFALGMVFVLFGLPLVVGGAVLLSLDGSGYYFPAGIAFILSGLLLMQRHWLGALTYALLFLATLVWSVWEVGFDGWALMPRIFGLAVLMLLVVAALPALRRPRPLRPWVLAGLASVVMVVVVLAALMVAAGRPTAHDSVPTNLNAAAAGGAGWIAYDGTDAAQRYSPLPQIDRTNVDQLQRAWTYRTGDLPATRWGLKPRR